MQFIHLMKICIKYIDSDLKCIALGRFFPFIDTRVHQKKKKSHSPGGGLKRMIVFLSAQQMSVACPQYLKHMDHEPSFVSVVCVSCIGETEGQLGFHARSSALGEHLRKKGRELVSGLLGTCWGMLLKRRCSSAHREAVWEVVRLREHRVEAAPGIKKHQVEAYGGMREACNRHHFSGCTGEFTRNYCTSENTHFLSQELIYTSGRRMQNP